MRLCDSESFITYIKFEQWFPCTLISLTLQWPILFCQETSLKTQPKCNCNWYLFCIYPFSKSSTKLWEFSFKKESLNHIVKSQFWFLNSSKSHCTWWICIVKVMRVWQKWKLNLFWKIATFLNSIKIIHRQVKTSDIISQRFGDFMTPLSRVQMRIKLTNARSRVTTDSHSGGGYTNTLARI